MTTSKETISALIDGNLSAEETQQAIRDLRTDDSLRCCWGHYHLIGEAMRRNLPPTLARDLVQSVSAAIAREELPPRSAPATPAAQLPRRSLRRPLIGLGLAASVAGMAYLGAGMLLSEGPAMLPPMAAAPAAAVTVAAQTTPAAPQEVLPNQPVPDPQLNQYLNNHLASAGIAGMNGQMLPHIRIVGYRPGQE